MSAPQGIRQALLRVAVDAPRGFYSDFPFVAVEGEIEGLYRAALPGRPGGSRYFYYAIFVDSQGLSATYPHNAPDQLSGFRILSASAQEDSGGDDQ